MAIDLELLYHISYGMYIMSVNHGGSPTGCLINTCMQITSENPIFAVSLNKGNYTHNIALTEKRFSLCILSEQTPVPIMSAFGFRSGKDTNKFENVAYSMLNGLPVIAENSCANLLFDVIETADMETHSVIFGRLVETVAGDGAVPMDYTYYRQVIKGRAPKNAPTYQPVHKAENTVVPEAKARWVCEVCGYVYEGDDIPADFTCPVCGVERSNFKKQ